MPQQVIKLAVPPKSVLNGNTTVRNAWAVQYLANLKRKNPARYYRLIDTIKQLDNPLSQSLNGLGFSAADLLDNLSTATKIYGDTKQTQAQIDAIKKQQELDKLNAEAAASSSMFDFQNTQKMYDTIKMIAIPVALVAGGIMLIKMKKRR